jgi:hypothetical protein
MNAVFSNGGTEDNPEFPRHMTPNRPLQSRLPADSGAGNIDKIRDILFGSNMRDYEQRFARLEEALKKGIVGSARHHAPPPGIAGGVSSTKNSRRWKRA